MTARRTFLKSAVAAGLTFCGCQMLNPSNASGAQAARARPVSVGGKRVMTIDTHCHCQFHQTLDILGVPSAAASNVGVEKTYFDENDMIVQRLATMDAQGIDMEVLSVNTFWYGAERDKAEKIVNIHNEKLAQLCAAHPTRFAAFASLALQFPDLAVQQLETAVKKQGLRGAAIGANVQGEEFSDPKFHPVWAKAEELGVLLFIHPASTPELAKRFTGNGWLSNTIGNPLDTTIALNHLVFEGTMDRHPRLKVLAAHGGGFLPIDAGRADHACAVSPKQCSSEIKLKKRPSEYLKDFYYDSLLFSDDDIRHLVAKVGADRIMMGSDYPYPWVENPVTEILKSTALTDAQKTAILGGNAATVLGIKAS